VSERYDDLALLLVSIMPICLYVMEVTLAVCKRVPVNIFFG